MDGLRRLKKVAVASAIIMMLLVGSSTFAFHSTHPRRCLRHPQRLAALNHSTRKRRRTTRRFSIAATNGRDDGVESARSASVLRLPKGRDTIVQTVAAPMVAASEYPFRCLCRQYGVDLTFTQMLHARNLVDKASFRENHLDLYEYDDESSKEILESQLNFFKGSDVDPTMSRKAPSGEVLAAPEPLRPFASGPVIVQLAGNSVDLVTRAAHLIYEHTNGRVDGIDYNLGCPQGIARKGNYGAFLMEEDEDLVCQILSELRKTLPSSVAVSAKIRLPFDDDATLERRIPRLVETGIDFMTIHGRTLRENKTRVGPCRVDRLTKAVQLAQICRPGFPVVANGGVESVIDAIRLKEETGAAAVMSSEALLERPDLFLDSSSAVPDQLSSRRVLLRQLQFARDYLQWCKYSPPLPGVLGQTGGSFNVARGHLFKFLHRYLQEHTDMRERLASHGMNRLVQAEDFLDELQGRYDKLSDAELAQLGSSTVDSSWYRRHRGASTRVHVRQRTTDQVVNGKTLSVEERKKLARDRIALLQKQRSAKQKSMKV